MVHQRNLYIQHTANIPSGKRYIIFLERVSNLRGLDVAPATMRTESDVINFVQPLTNGSMKNYKTVLRHYVKMVAANNL